MAARDGSPIQPESALPGKSVPDDALAIALRLKQLGQDIASETAGQLELLVRFDELKGWQPSSSLKWPRPFSKVSSNHCRNWKRDAVMPRRRADAAVLMAESAWQNAGRDMATADRYQVIVSVDAARLRDGIQSESLPANRPTVHGAGPLAAEAARRIACHCSLSAIAHSGGEAVDIGRKSRLWPPATTLRV